MKSAFEKIVRGLRDAIAAHGLRAGPDPGFGLAAYRPSGLPFRGMATTPQPASALAQNVAANKDVAR